ncbi:Uncharacterised protein [Serratia ficaria]|nr:hypothetical protein [Serratia ficaria]CAI1022207.1 Uncharacterised protein [Serratia ficaria]CAI1861066.1 Uncharacterised protein [Serratia ficaria]CAI2471670.1 Uncharacterised protein [Serratia ficaria]
MNIKRHMMSNAGYYMLAGLFVFWLLLIGLTVLTVELMEVIHG